MRATMLWNLGTGRKLAFFNLAVSVPCSSASDCTAFIGLMYLTMMRKMSLAVWSSNAGVHRMAVVWFEIPIDCNRGTRTVAALNKSWSESSKKSFPTRLSSTVNCLRRALRLALTVAVTSCSTCRLCAKNKIKHSNVEIPPFDALAGTIRRSSKKFSK